jgi:hypothetical protein
MATPKTDVAIKGHIGHPAAIIISHTILTP